MGVGWLETTGQFPFWGKKDMGIKPQPRSRAVLFVSSRAGSSGWAALPQSGENPTADKTSADNTLLIIFRPHPPPLFYFTALAEQPLVSFAQCAIESSLCRASSRDLAAVLMRKAFNRRLWKSPRGTKPSHLICRELGVCHKKERCNRTIKI